MNLLIFDMCSSPLTSNDQRLLENMGKRIDRTLWAGDFSTSSIGGPPLLPNSVGEGAIELLNNGEVR
jgi:hypothetical protein